MEKDLKLELKLLILSFLVPVLIQVAMFGFQVANGVISIWNIVSTFLVVVIFLGGIKSNKRSIIKARYINPNREVTGGSTVERKNNQKMGIKARVVFFIVALVLAGASVLCFHFYNVKSKGLEVVEATVVWQKGETNVEVKQEDDEEVHSETRSLNVTVLYMFNGGYKTADLKAANITELKVKDVKIYIDAQGEAVCDCGRIDAFKYEAIVFLSFAVIMLLVAILGLGVELAAGGIMSLLGVGLAILVGSQFIENILYNDLVCFLFAFIDLGLALMIYGILSKILKKPESVVSYNNVLAQENQVESLKFERVCSYCGSKLKENENQCECCGASVSVVNRDL